MTDRPLWNGVLLTAVLALSFIRLSSEVRSSFMDLRVVHRLVSISQGPLSIVDSSLNQFWSQPEARVGDSDSCKEICTSKADSIRIRIALNAALACATHNPEFLRGFADTPSGRDVVTSLLYGALLYQNAQGDDGISVWRQGNASSFFYYRALRTETIDRGQYLALAAAIDPLNLDYAWASAIRELGDGGYDGVVLSAFNKVVDLAPKGTYRSYMAQGFIGYMKSDANASSSFFQLAADVSDNTADLAEALAWLGRTKLYLSREYLVAAEVLQRSASLRSSVWTSTEAGLAYELEGLLDLAGRQYRDAMEKHPGEQAPVIALARYHWRSDRCEESVHILRQIMIEDEVNSTINNWLKAYPDSCADFAGQTGNW